MQAPVVSDEILFHCEGNSRQSALLWYPIVFGVIGVLLMILLAAVGMPGVGRWWLWVLALVPFYFLGRWEMRRSHVSIDLVAVRNGGRRLRISGRGGNLDEELAGEPERWTTKPMVPQRPPGPVLYPFNVLVKTASGREIGYTTLAGRWPSSRAR
jgi:hypothetical protein